MISGFVASHISVSQFKWCYLDMFKKEEDPLSEEVYHILNKLFFDVDSYCEDPVLRDEDDLADDQLVACAWISLEKLTAN